VLALSASIGADYWWSEAPAARLWAYGDGQCALALGGNVIVEHRLCQ
jgi:hypothetical protein